ncbi:MAG TPA: vitamin K epoxide reductase family protein [Nannocystaceae bacterium]|nr:vitamin K epoxide reductase family protein [Nannocystaceae bacterium]
MVDSQRRHPHPIPLGALVVGLAAIPGIIFSVFLTVIKLLSDSHCAVSILSACSTSCAEALKSPLSTLFHAPISIYSTSYFLVLLGFVVAILWRPSPFIAVARPLLLVFAAAGVLAIAVLAAYSALVLGGPCQYCIIIYGLTLTAALGVSLLHSDGYRPSLRALTDRRLLTSSATQIAVLGFLAATTVQMVAYRSKGSEIVFTESCVVRHGLPATPFTTPTAGPPRATVAIVLDLACPHCRTDYATWRAYASTHPDIRLAVYHFPRHSPCASTRFNAHAEQNNACLGARAAVCVERLRPGAGVAMIDQLFALQDGPTPYFSDVTVGEVARAAGLADIPADLSAPDALEHPFYRCLDAPESLDLIHEHVSFAEDSDVGAPPATFIHFTGPDGVPSSPMIRVRGGKNYRDPGKALEDAKNELQTALQDADEAP